MLEIIFDFSIFVLITVLMRDVNLLIQRTQIFFIHLINL